MIGAITDFLFGGGNNKRANDAGKRADSRSRAAMQQSDQWLSDNRQGRDDLRKWTDQHYGETAKYANHFMEMNRGDRDIASVWNTDALHRATGHNHWAGELGAEFTGMLGDFFGDVSGGAPRVSGGGFSGREFEGREFSGREFSGREYDAGETEADFSQAELNQEFLEQLDAAREGGNEMFDEYRDEYGEYRGLRQQIRDDALNYNSGRYANHLAGQAAADAARNQRQQQRAMHSQAASMGLNPNSGRFAAMQQGQSMRNAAQLASAQSNARMQADEIGYQRLMAAEQTGAFLPEAMRQNQEIDLGYQTIAGDYYRAGLEGRVGLERERMAQQAGRDVAGIQTTQRSRAAAQQATASTHNAATQATASTYNAAMNATASTINSANAANASTQSSAMAANASMYGSNLNAQLGALDLGLGYSTDLRNSGIDLANAGANVMGVAAGNQQQGLSARNAVNNSHLQGHISAHGIADTAYRGNVNAHNTAAGVTVNKMGQHVGAQGNNLGFAGGMFGSIAGMF